MVEFNEQEFSFMTEIERYDAFVRLFRSPDPADEATLEGLYFSADPLIPLILLQYLGDVPEKKSVATILRMIEKGADVVSRTAMTAYKRNHYSAKARLLKPFVLSPEPRVCRFAIRTLSRVGFAEILPIIIRELPDQKGPIQTEMIEALRYLPDSRSVPVLLPLADSSDETIRVQAFSVLAEIQTREKALPLRYFLNKIKDRSERIRRASLRALGSFPARNVSTLILEAALRPDEPEESRVYAIRALASFPAAKWIRPLALLAERSDSPVIRLSVEITLRSFPSDILRKGLLPLLRESEEPALRQQAALLLADFLGREPDVREVLFELWRRSDEAIAVDLVDALKILGGPETAALLRESIHRSPLLAYAAASALAHMRGSSHGPAIISLLADPTTPHLVRQALLNRYAKRGIEEDARVGLRPHLFEALSSPVTNIRYLALQALGWYPLADRMPELLDLLVAESTPELVRTASRQIALGLGQDPLPLIALLREHPRRRSLMGHAVRILTSRHWAPARSAELLDSLRKPPLSLLDEYPETFFLICVHLLEYGAVTVQGLWPLLSEGPRLRQFLAALGSAMASARRRFPPLPLSFMESRMLAEDAATRIIYYDVLAEDASGQAVEYLTSALLRESDPQARARGAMRLRGLLGKVAP